MNKVRAKNIKSKADDIGAIEESELYKQENDDVI